MYIRDVDTTHQWQRHAPLPSLLQGSSSQQRENRGGQFRQRTCSTCLLQPWSPTVAAGLLYVDCRRTPSKYIHTLCTQTSIARNERSAAQSARKLRRVDDNSWHLTKHNPDPLTAEHDTGTKRQRHTPTSNHWETSASRACASSLFYMRREAGSVGVSFCVFKEQDASLSTTSFYFPVQASGPFFITTTSPMQSFHVVPVVHMYSSESLVPV